MAQTWIPKRPWTPIEESDIPILKAAWSVWDDVLVEFCHCNQKWFYRLCQKRTIS